MKSDIFIPTTEDTKGLDKLIMRGLAVGEPEFDGERFYKARFTRDIGNNEFAGCFIKYDEEHIYDGDGNIMSLRDALADLVFPKEKVSKFVREFISSLDLVMEDEPFYYEKGQLMIEGVRLRIADGTSTCSLSDFFDNEECPLKTCKYCETCSIEQDEIHIEGHLILLDKPTFISREYGLVVRTGQWCEEDEDGEPYPDWSLTLIHELDKSPEQYLYYEQDDIEIALHNYGTSIGKTLQLDKFVLGCFTE